MFLCFKLETIVSSALIHSTLLSSWLLSQVWNIKTQPLYIFNRESPQNSEPQNGLRRGLDFIALPVSSIDNCMAELFPEAILIFELVLAKTLSSFFFNSKNFVKRVLQFATSLMMAILNIKMSLCAWIRIRFLQYPNFSCLHFEPNYSKKHHFYLSEVEIRVQNGQGVVNRLVPCLKCMELACQVLHGYFGQYIYFMLVKMMMKHFAS